MGKDKVIVTLGADPEFELVVGGQVVRAASVLHEDVRLPWGSVGVDGAGAPLELRPRPGRTAKGLVQNLGKLLMAVPKVVGGSPSTISEAYAVGGHVHVGFDPIPDLSYRDLMDEVDEVVGDILYDLNTRTRLNAGYGERGDWRYQPWGVEYRTPPSSVWSHPQVALTFVGAIKWAVQEVLRGENPLKSPALPRVRAAAKEAADFVKRYGGRLHWGAWQDLVGEVDIAKTFKARVRRFSGDMDPKLLDDLGAMCARLGIPSLSIIPIRRNRGDYISNVPGYGELWDGASAFTLGEPLCLSWRFRTDPEFRREELPKLEAAIAATLGKIREDDDGGRLVKEVVRFKGPLKPTAPTGDTGEGSRVGADEAGEEETEAEPEGSICVACGEVIYPAIYAIVSNSGDTYCQDCYYERFEVCDRCGAEVDQEKAYASDYGYVYCPSCYSALHTTCAHCGIEIRWDDAILDDDGGHAYCLDCHRQLFVTCEACGADVPVDYAYEHDGYWYCEDCFHEHFDHCDR